MSRTQVLLTKIVKICSEIRDIKQSNKLKIILLLIYLRLTARMDTQALFPHSKTQVAWMIYVVTATRTVVPITKAIYHAEHARFRIMRYLSIIRYPL